MSTITFAHNTKKHNANDWLATTVIYIFSALVLSALALPIGEIIINGYDKLSFDFITQLPEDSGRSGGISSILASTALIVLIAMITATPLALCTAIMLTEYLPEHSLRSSIIRGSLDVLAGVPSVVFGLFGLAFFCQTLELGYSILAGGLTLSCMILPTLSRSITSALHTVGDEYRISGAALCLSRLSTLWHVTLPVVLPGIAVSVLLGLTRAIAETALLLFTSGYSDKMPSSITDSGRSISVHIYELATNVPGGQQSAYGSALVLLLSLLLLSVLLHLTTHKLQRRMIRG